MAHEIEMSIDLEDIFEYVHRNNGCTPLRPGEFTASDYIEWEREKGREISPQRASSYLNRMEKSEYLTSREARIPPHCERRKIYRATDKGTKVIKREG